MRKSWWAVAAGLGTLVLLTGCGGSPSSTSAAGASSSSAAQNTPSTQSPATSPTGGGKKSANSASAKATGRATYPAAGSTSSDQPIQTAPQPQPSGNLGSIPPVGTTVMIVEHTTIGYVLAEATTSAVVYTYANDKKGGVPTCTGSCAAVWLPVTGVPQAAPGEHFPGTFGLVTRSDGVKQITYNGYPLYTLKGASFMSTKGNGVDGLWHVVMLSASDIS